jgi:hypothetical protein
MRIDTLLRELVRAGITLGLRGDQLAVRGRAGDRLRLRPDLIAHKAVLVDLLAWGGFDAAMQDAAGMEALVAEGWDGPGIDVDRLLRAIDYFGKRPVKLVRVALHTREHKPEAEP